MEYAIHLGILVSIYAILALSLNLITGYAGLISVAHAAFFGMGAYATGLLTKEAGFSFLFSVFIGVALSVVVAYLTSRIVRALSGDYYVLGTLALNFLIYTVMLNWISLTRGPFGITGIPRPFLLGYSFSSSVAFLVFSSSILLIIFILCRFITKSSFGRVLKAIREDEGALQVFGYNTLNFKSAVFCIGAGFAAVAGSLYASYVTFIDPTTFTVLESAFIISIIVLGGLANLKGSLIGSVVLVVVPELLRFIGFGSDVSAYVRLGLYGLLLVFLMLYRPKGLFGEYSL